MQRRNFIKGSLGCCATGILPGCAGKIHLAQKARYEKNTVIVDISEFGDSDHLYINHPGERVPVALIRNGNNYRALLMLCTHQFCETLVVENEIICPCHGARFDRRGNVRRGPAKLALTNYQTIVNSNKLVISLSPQKRSDPATSN